MIPKVYFRSLSRLAVGLACLALAGCVRSVSSDLPADTSSYATLEAAPVNQDYRVAPLDVLKVTVFLEPDLSNDELRVTNEGIIALPLVGEIAASGKTTSEIDSIITERLAKFITNPEVSVLLAESSAMRVTIEGAVREPGIYPLTGRTGLLDLVAAAKGPTETAKLKQAIVLRTVDGQQYGAVFDLNKIRGGQVPDPQLRGGDQVVIGIDAVRESYRQVLQSIPLATLVRLF